MQVAKRLNYNHIKSVFISGGGAKNKYLIERINHHFKGEIILPNKVIIDFKEAIIFGFLGVLYLDRIPNTLASVTGAPRNLIGGVMHIPD
jgi:anhydro-N-acetylmuramic acid kinase